MLCSGCAFFDRRGFGPLAQTGLELLGLPYHAFGGEGNGMGLAGVVAAAPRARVPAPDAYRFSAEMMPEEKRSYVEGQLAAGR